MPSLVRDSVQRTRGRPPHRSRRLASAGPEPHRGGGRLPALRGRGPLGLYRANRGVYGVRKLWHAARRAGHPWGRDQVGRLMRLAGIDGVRRGRRSTLTTRRDSSAPRHPDLIDRAWATPSRPDQWWVADFTYVWTHVGFVYVSFVTDVYSRRILGWRVSTAKTTPLVMSALEQALFTRRQGNATFTATGLSHHFDAGAQYTSLVFTEALLGLCAAESRSGRGWPPADRLVVWVMARARTSKISRPGEVITGPGPTDSVAGAASPSRFGDVKAGRAVQPVPEGSNEAEEKGDVREEICA